jgi:catalytic domain of components of various dehydrogenase complexes
MEEGTIETWHKKEGDKVAKGEILLEIATDKITSEIESEFDGVVLKLIAAEGEDVPVQGVIAIIGEEGEQVDTGSKPADPIEESKVQESSREVAVKSETLASVTSAGGRVKISPLAKKTAEKMGIDYTSLAGSGPGGRIIQQDVLDAKDKVVVKEEKAPVQIVQEVKKEGGTVLKGMRKVVAERMLQSHLEIPPVTQNMKIDVTKLIEFRKSINETREEKKFSINDFVLKAVAKALAKNPHIMVSLIDGQIFQNSNVNIGMAVSTDTGLIVPVINDADKLSLEALSSKAKDLALRARENKLDIDEYKGSTFTVSNLGMFGVESFTPIINQPDAAILGVCSVEDELALEDGVVVQKKKMKISLTYDHRLLDGAVAAKFQQEIKKLLENPMEILL